MAERKLTYQQLQRETRKKIIHYALTSGAMGPMLPVGTSGVVILLFILNALPLALLFGAIFVVFGGLIIKENLRTRDLSRLMMREAINEWFPKEKISVLRAFGTPRPFPRPDEQFQTYIAETILRSLTVFNEIVFKIDDIVLDQGNGDALYRFFSDAAALVDSQFESAERIQEIERVIAIIGIPQTDLAQHQRAADKVKSGQKSSLQLRDENVRALMQEVQDNSKLIGEIQQNLETMMLQVFQMEKDASDIVRTEEIARESAENLERLQNVLTARRNAAKRLLGVLHGTEQLNEHRV